MTAAREALATLKPQAAGATPLHTPAHQPPTPSHPETPVRSQEVVEETGQMDYIFIAEISAPKCDRRSVQTHGQRT